MRSFLFRHKTFLKVFADVFLWVLVTIPAYGLRLEASVFLYWTDILWVITLLIPFKLSSIYFFNHYKPSWRYSSTKDLISLIKSVSVVTAIYLLISVLSREVLFIPLSIPFIEGMLAFLLLGGLRFFVHIYLLRNKKVSSNALQKRVLIAGAGSAGTMIAKEMLKHPEAGLKPVAFVDDAIENIGSNILGIPVEGKTSRIQEIAKEKAIDELIIAMPSEAGSVIRRIVEGAHAINLSHRIIPGLYDLISGKISISNLREVDVEDLLRREPIELEKDNIQSYIKNRRVLVTGAGGSIGSEIVRQVARFNPQYIILLGRGENSIHSIMHEIAIQFPNLKVYVKIVDIRDKISLKKVFVELKPDVVFHAAAHKHVTLMEMNPDQAIFNNLGGTSNLVDLSVVCGVKYFVNISTDKAVNPTSVMGATKRLAEFVVQNASEKVFEDRYFVSVRFGNVLGSRGSVIPIFKEQIKNGGPVTVTDPDMVRYFMTIPEAAQLVLQAGALNENGAVFVLDMGEPIRIYDMAKDLIKLSGFEPETDIPITFTGRKAGEKLFEELITDKEGIQLTRFNKIMVVKSNEIPPHFEHKLENLFMAAAEYGDQILRAMIKDLLPCFSGESKKKEKHKV